MFRTSSYVMVEMADKFKMTVIIEVSGWWFYVSGVLVWFSDRCVSIFIYYKNRTEVQKNL